MRSASSAGSPPEKGIVEAIEIAQRAGRPLRIAAKIGPDRRSSATTTRASSARPSRRPGSDVEFLGELDQADRDQLFAESYASLMPGSWPEPFGLVAIEAMACGTPVIARRIGALPEIIRDGVDGFFGDDADQMAFRVAGVDGLDRATIRRSVLERFSATRMTDGYEALYRSMLEVATPPSDAPPIRGAASGGSGPGHTGDRGTVRERGGSARGARPGSIDPDMEEPGRRERAGLRSAIGSGVSALRSSPSVTVSVAMSSACRGESIRRCIRLAVVTVLGRSDDCSAGPSSRRARCATKAAPRSRGRFAGPRRSAWGDLDAGARHETAMSPRTTTAFLPRLRGDDGGDRR